MDDRLRREGNTWNKEKRITTHQVEFSGHPCPKCGSWYRNGTRCNKCGEECRDKAVFDVMFSQVGKPMKGKAWDSKQHKYIARR